MIRVYIISNNGEGFVNSMDFEDLEDVKLYTANLGNNCEITLEEIEEEKK
jgi:hypothetical protein